MKMPVLSRAPFLGVIAITVWATLLRFGNASQDYNEDKMRELRSSVKDMFQSSYEAYLNNAYPLDELKPLTCSGSDTLGGYSLTLIDSLDTLAILGNHSEFRRIYGIISKIEDMNLNVNVSVFETNIRIVGGLLSAHLFAKSAGVDVLPTWPCEGPLLKLASNVARRLVPAFDTLTGMPYGTVNLMHGVPPEETPVSCVAGVGTFIVEFSVLSQLTGEPLFEEKALGAIEGLWKVRSKLNLVGNHVNVMTGKWTAVDAGIGAGVDSYFEYLVKGSLLRQDERLLGMFRVHYEAIKDKMLSNDWYFWVSMFSGNVSLPIFQSLEAFWPGVLSMIGKDEAALKSVHNYRSILKQYGFLPEFYDVYAGKPVKNKEGYPLRPELIESLVYLYQANKDPYLLEIGEMVLNTMQHSAKTNCGYATVKDVRTHLLEDRMESFFLAETTKYLYLLFDPENPVHGSLSRAQVMKLNSGQECIIGVGGMVFNTEAHPMDPSLAKCCQRFHEDAIHREAETHSLPYQCFRPKNTKSKFFKDPSVDPQKKASLKNKLRNIFKLQNSRNCSSSITTFSSKGLYCDSHPHHFRYLSKAEIFSEG